MKKVAIVVGARPQFIKAAPVLHALRKYPLEILIIHTGQHYDVNLSEIFFNELSIPTADYHLSCGSGDGVTQYVTIMERLSSVLARERPDLTVVFGDTNSTGASALTSRLLKIPVAHIEAGLREFDKDIPEEINKLVTDALADFYFCPTQTAVNVLSASGILENVVLCGDPVIDLLSQRKGPLPSPHIENIGMIEPGKYYFATCHRQRNKENRTNLENILKAFTLLPLPVVFSMHPGTRNAIEQLGLEEYLKHLNIVAIEPQGFWQTQSLIYHSDRVLTDSGGLIKEAYFHGKYVSILDCQTEWVEVLKEGKGMVCGADIEKILFSIQQERDNSTPNTSLGNGDSSMIIAREMNKFLNR